MGFTDGRGVGLNAVELGWMFLLDLQVRPMIFSWPNYSSCIQLHSTMEVPWRLADTMVLKQYLGWVGWLFEPTSCFDEMVQNSPNATNFKMGPWKDPVESMSFEGFGIDECLASCTGNREPDVWYL